MTKTNYQILEENTAATLDFADGIPRAKARIITDTKPKLATVKEMVDKEDFSGAITMLDQIKDNNIGIIWHESPPLESGTRVLVRDARNVITDPKILRQEAGEKYAMQILNEVRAGLELIDQEPAIGEKTKKLAKEKLMHIAKSSLEDVGNLPDDIRKFNTQIIHTLEEAGIPNAWVRLNFAKEAQNFKDEHRHVVTLSTAKDNGGKEHTVTEADIMLNGLTEAQKNQWEAIAKTTKDQPNTKLPGMDWYNNMPRYKKNLLREVASDVASGKKVIPTQLLSDIPGVKNGYKKVTAIKDNETPGTKSIILSQQLHSGTPATKIKLSSPSEKQAIVDENINQLQTFVPPKDRLNLNILTSNIGSESFVQDQLHKTAENSKQKGIEVAISASPINRARLFGAGKNHAVFNETLISLGADLAGRPETQNISKFLKQGNSFIENVGEFLSGGLYKSTATKAKSEIANIVKTEKDHELAQILSQAIAAKDMMTKPMLAIRGNANLKIAAAMNGVDYSIKKGSLSYVASDKTKASVGTRLDFCKSGKDRTGYLATKSTHEAVSIHLKVDPSSTLGQQNMLSQVAGGHTQEMAGIQGGSIGCHSIKTGIGTALSNERQDQVAEGIINQQSSHHNSKIKILKGNARKTAVKEFEKDFGKKANFKKLEVVAEKTKEIEKLKDLVHPVPPSEIPKKRTSISEGVYPKSTPPVKSNQRDRSNSL